MVKDTARPDYKSVEAEAVLIEIRQHIRRKQFTEAMALCDHLKCMLSAKRSLTSDMLRDRHGAWCKINPCDCGVASVRKGGWPI